MISHKHHKPIKDTMSWLQKDYHLGMASGTSADKKGRQLARPKGRREIPPEIWVISTCFTGSAIFQWPKKKTTDQPRD